MARFDGHNRNLWHRAVGHFAFGHSKVLLERAIFGDQHLGSTAYSGLGREEGTWCRVMLYLGTEEGWARGVSHI